MITKTRKRGLLALAVIALLALAAFSAACGGNETTTTSTTATGSTTSTSAASTDETTVAVGGKTLDDYKAEIPGLEQALAADPTDLYSLESLAVAHYQLGEYEQAVDAYLKMLAIQEDAFTRNNLGNAYRDWGKTEEAKAAYHKAIEDDPTLKYPYVNLSRVLQKAGDIEGAIAILEEGAKHVGADDQGTIDAAEQALTSTTTTT